MGEDIRILQYNDGWSFRLNGNEYSWNHNDTDLGTESIKNLLEDLGYTSVKVEECY